jgi:hypothetical protein
VVEVGWDGALGYAKIVGSLGTSRPTAGRGARPLWTTSGRTAPLPLEGLGM